MIPFLGFRAKKRGFAFSKPPFVIPIGFEPMAYCLEGSCSIQLSYGTNYIFFIPNQLLYLPDSYRESYGTFFTSQAKNLKWNANLLNFFIPAATFFNTLD